jgi:DNA-directed RNA polymerase alpha subunit
MRTFEEIKGAIKSSISSEANMKINNELLLDIREVLVYMSGYEPKKEAENEVVDPLDSVSIHSLPISTRAKSGLTNYKIDKVSQLRNLTGLDISRMRNMGNKTIKEIVDALKEYGIDMPEYTMRK